MTPSLASALAKGSRKRVYKPIAQLSLLLEFPRGVSEDPPRLAA